jgi:hypothetical protein
MFSIAKTPLFPAVHGFHWRVKTKTEADELNARFRAATTPVVKLLLRRQYNAEGISAAEASVALTKIARMPATNTCCGTDPRHGLAMGVTGLCWKCCKAILTVN